MSSSGNRFQANRFSPLDTVLGYQNTAKGMTHDVGAVRYSLESLLQIRRIPSGVSPDQASFPYARLPFELRQTVLRELMPTKSIWNGTSFPKSCPKQYQQAYFENTKYLQNRALAQ